VDKQSAEDLIRSMTGFEEIAIERRFGKDLEKLGESMMSLRAMAFVMVRRENGGDDTAAYNTVMGMPLDGITDMFADEPDEDDEQGKAPGDETPPTPTS
jgi:hypothetical protein